MLGDVKDPRNAIVLHDGPTLAGHADLALWKTQGNCLFSVTFVRMLIPGGEITKHG